MEIRPRQGERRSGVAKRRSRFTAIVAACTVITLVGVAAAEASTEYGAWKTIDIGGIGAARARNYVTSNTTTHSFRAFTVMERIPYTSGTIPAYAAGARALLYEDGVRLLASTTYTYNVGPINNGTNAIVLSATPTKTYSDPMAAYSNGRARGTNSSGSSVEYYFARSADVFNY